MSGGYERITKKLDFHWKLRLFLIAINLILAYLVLNIKVLFIPSIIGLGLVVFLLVISIISLLRSQAEPLKISNIVSMSKKYLRINKAYTIVAMVGLIIATLIVSQSIILSNTYQQDSLDNYLNGREGTGIKVFVEGTSKIELEDNWDDKFEEAIPEINNEFEFKINDIKTDASYQLRIAEGPPKVITEGKRLGDFFVPFISITPKSWSINIFNQLSVLPSFSQDLEFNPKDKIFIIPSTSDLEVEKVNFNGSIRILLGEDIRRPYQKFSYYNLSITYIWKPNADDLKYIATNELLPQSVLLTSYLSKPTLYINLEEEWNLYNKIIATPISEEDNLKLPIITANSFVYVVAPLISKESISSYMSRLNQFTVAVRIWVNSEANGIVAVTSPLNAQLDDYLNSNSVPISIVSLLATGPVIGLALFLVYFSLTLVEQRKARIIAIIKTRGASKNQIQSMMFSEAAFNGITSALVGMFLSVPLLLSLSNLISSDISLNYSTIFLYVPETWLWRLPLIGIILAIDIYISSILKLSSIETYQDDPEDDIKHSPTVFQKIPTDFLLFAASMIYWFVVYFIPIKSSQLFNIIVIYIGPLMLVLLLITFPLVLSKIFNITIDIFASIVWKINGGLFSFSIRNMKKFKLSTSKLFTFYILGLILASMSLTLPVTFNNWGNNQIRYEIGASDVFIDGIDSKNETRWELLQNITGIKTVSEIIQLKLTGFDDTTKILGVDPQNFWETTYWQSEFSKFTINELTEKISSNLSIAMQETVMKALKLKIGDQFSISRRAENTVMNITSSFKYFPNLVFTLPTQDSDGNYIVENIHIVTSIRTVQAIDPSDTFSKYGAYIKLEENANLTQVRAEIHELTKMSTKIEATYLNSEKDDFFNSNETGVVHSTFLMMLIVTILTSAIAQFYFSYLTVNERKKEIAILKSFGMVSSQISLSLIIETLILQLVSLIFGIFGGIFLAKNFMLILSNSNQNLKSGPPVELLIPINTIGIFSSLFVIFGLISLLIPINMLTRKQTGIILRTE